MKKMKKMRKMKNASNLPARAGPPCGHTVWTLLTLLKNPEAKTLLRNNASAACSKHAGVSQRTLKVCGSRN